jgi:hypothetical protein
MSGDCPRCVATAEIRATRQPRTKLSWLGFVPAILAALAPKCPMCLVAYLSAFGVTFGMASFALSALVPIAIVCVALAVGFVPRNAMLRSVRDGI